MGKNWEIVGYYKNILIYYDKNKKLTFGNKKFTSHRAKSLHGAKILITKYIKTLNKREQRSLKYLKY